MPHGSTACIAWPTEWRWILRIFIGGSLENVPRDKEDCFTFVAALARATVEQGHTLLNGCRSSLDLGTAKAAQDWLVNNGRQPADQIKSYCLKGAKPVHNVGRVLYSELSDWNMSHPDLKLPEQIDQADVTIFVAGGEGTFWAKNWAYYARKPILGIPRFGGAGETIYEQELTRLRAAIPPVAEEYEMLNQLVTDNFQKYANDTIDLAKRLAMPRSVFAIMTFKPEFADVIDSYQSAFGEFDFKAERTDDPESPESLERIIPRIEMGIRRSAIVIADVSESSPNVFYELGFAKALGKDVIVTAKEGTPRPFDISDVPILYWQSQIELKQKLRACLAGLRHKYGM